MANILTTEDIIERCIKTHGDTYDYSKVIYKGYYAKIEIICKKHGSFWQDARNHYKLKAGCPICAGNIRMNKDTFVEKANTVHGLKYDYSKVEYVNNRTYVNILCKEHGLFKQTPTKHLSGCGCPQCGVIARENTMVEKYGVSHALQSQIIQSNMKNSVFKRYGVENVMHDPDVKRSVNETKRLNNIFGRSKTEDSLYRLLCEIFDKSDIERQYSDERYSFNCDFYIKSRDLFIELNAFWSHGGHWYNEDNAVDRLKAEKWLCMNKKIYKNCYDVWTCADVLKRNTAKKYKLNYIVFWDNNLCDFYEWVKRFCPNGKDYIKEYSWI